MEKTQILSQLPYAAPFLFVDEILSVSDKGISGTYTFAEDAYFYKGHFPANPVTPGVILTECMAQIGLVCLGIYLINAEKNAEKPKFALSNTTIDFFIPVLPNQKVKVFSEVIYFRFQKLKCNVKMCTNTDEVIAKGSISGMVIKNI